MPTLALAVAAVALATAPQASAEPCGPDLVDGNGMTWDLHEQGRVNDAGEDAFDTTGNLAVDGTNDGIHAPYPVPADANACTHEDDGREVRYPTAVLEGVEVTRTTMVSATTGWTRLLTLLRNPSGTSRIVRAELGADVGSDSATEIVSTSSGDAVVSAADRWVVSEEDDFTQHAAVVISDGLLGDLARELTSLPLRAGEDDQIDRYVLEIGPGDTVALMHVLGAAETRGQALAAAQADGDGVEAMYFGLSAAERAALRNWPAGPDIDADGIPNASDRCPRTADPAQADLDGDGQGDACDADIDGDGLTNAVEAGLGTNPAATDGDGDGVADAADRCPSLVGPDNGCPAPAPPAGTAGDGSPTGAGGGSTGGAGAAAAAPRRLTVTGTARRKGSRRTLTVSGRLTPPAGVRCAGTVTVRLISGDRVQATRRTRVASSCRYSVRIALHRRLRTRRGVLVVSFGGTDRLLPFVAAPKRVRLR